MTRLAPIVREALEALEAGADGEVAGKRPAVVAALTAAEPPTAFERAQRNAVEPVRNRRAWGSE
ncbi:MAG: hypothetical protein ACE5KF_00835 [Kiloniellaceae bacterium]